MSTINLALESFIALHELFFEQDETRKSFKLRPKSYTQDDPLDTYIARNLANYFRDKNVT